MKYKIKTVTDGIPTRMSTQDLEKMVRSAIDEMRDILDAADREGRDLTRDETDAYNELNAIADPERPGAAGELRRRKETGDHTPRRSGPTWAPGSGPARGEREGRLSASLNAGPRADGVFALEPEQRFTDHVRGLDHWPSDAGDPSEVSLGRFIRARVTGDWRGAEMERRVMSEGIDTLGGYLVPTSLSATMIDLARAQTRVIQAGARTVPMDAAEVTFAKILSLPTPAWRGEHVAIPVSDMNFGFVKLSAKTVGALCRTSVEMLQDAIGMPELIESALAQSLALEIDRVALRGIGAGTGLGAEPRGIIEEDGINHIDANGDPISYDMFSRAVEEILMANGPQDGLAAIYSPREGGRLDRLKDGESRPYPPPPSFQALRRFTTTQVPTNLGDTLDESFAVVGSFREQIIGIRQEINVEISREADDAFPKLDVLIRAYARLDTVLLHPGFISVIEAIGPVPS